MKKIIAVVLVLTCLLGVVVFSSSQMTLDIPEADNLYIRSGLTGDDARITDQEVISSIRKNINALRFKKKEKAGKGYSYLLKWCDAENNELIGIEIEDKKGTRIIYEGYYYVVKSTPIDIDAITRAFETALESD